MTPNGKKIENKIIIQFILKLKIEYYSTEPGFWGRNLVKILKNTLKNYIFLNKVLSEYPNKIIDPKY